MKKGYIYLIGAGPGDPQLMTIKGLKALEKSEVILYDALLDRGFAEYFSNAKIIKYVGKRCGQHSHSQSEINSLLIYYANAGYSVARLKGGDPFIFGRGGEELFSIREAEIPYEVIPGVSSMQAAGANFSIPLTHRGVSKKLMILNGHGMKQYSFSEWQDVAAFQGTVVLFMASKNIQFIANKLLDHGARGSLNIALLENVSMPGESIQYAKLEDVARFGMKKKTDGPGMILLGEVVSFFGTKGNHKYLNQIWENQYANSQ